MLLHLLEYQIFLLEFSHQKRVHWHESHHCIGKTLYSPTTSKRAKGHMFVSLVMFPAGFRILLAHITVLNEANHPWNHIWIPSNLRGHVEVTEGSWPVIMEPWHQPEIITTRKPRYEFLKLLRWELYLELLYVSAGFIQKNTACYSKYTYTKQDFSFYVLPKYEIIIHMAFCFEFSKRFQG